MIELFSRGDDAYFARTLGINNLRGHFSNLEKELRREFDDDDVTEAEVVAEAQEILADEPDVPGARRPAQPRLRAGEPDPRDGQRRGVPRAEAPQVADVLDPEDLRQAARRCRGGVLTDKPLFASPIYYPLAYYKGPDDDRSTRSRRTARTRSSG